MTIKTKTALFSSVVTAISLLLTCVVISALNCLYTNSSSEAGFSANQNKQKCIVVSLKSVIRNAPIPEPFIFSKGGCFLTFRATNSASQDWLSSLQGDWLINDVLNTSFVLPHHFILNLNFEFLNQSKFNDEYIDFSGIDPPYIVA